MNKNSVAKKPFVLEIGIGNSQDIVQMHIDDCMEKALGTCWKHASPHRVQLRMVRWLPTWCVTQCACVRCACVVRS